MRIAGSLNSWTSKGLKNLAFIYVQKYTAKFSLAAGEKWLGKE